MATSNQIAANLIINELMPRLKKIGVDISCSPVPPQIIANMAQLKSEGVLDTHTIRKIMDLAFDTTG